MQRTREELIAAILGKLDEMTEDEMQLVIRVYESSQSQQGTFQADLPSCRQDAV